MAGERFLADKRHLQSNLEPCRGHVTTFPFRVPSDRGALV